MVHGKNARYSYSVDISILTPYGAFTCAVNNIKSEAEMAGLTGGGTSHSSWGDRYCLRKMTLLSLPAVLFTMWGFLRGALVEVPQAWILLRGRGVLGMGPGSPGNACFPILDTG